MKKLPILIIFLSLITSNSFSEEFKSCSKQEMDNVWSRLMDDKSFNDKERFCLAAKTLVFLKEVFIKDLSPLTPKEEEWVLGEYDYLRNVFLKNPKQSSKNRVEQFLKHKLKLKYDIFNNYKVTKENLTGVMWAIQKSHKTFEMQSWANTVSSLIASNMYEDYMKLVQRNEVKQHPLAFSWSSVILPKLLIKGIVINN